MGRLKEELRRKRQQRQVRTLTIGAGAVALLLAVVVSISLMIGGSLSNGPATNTGNSQLASEKVDETGANSSGTEDSEGNSSEEIPEPEPEELRIIMVGDMLMHDRIINSGKKDDGTYNYDHLFTNVKDEIQAADIAIVNQETIMGGEEFGYSGYPKFNSPYALADAEVSAGFNVILHATNHTTDMGKEAVLNCMNYWDTNYPDIAYLGINKTQEDQDNNIYVYEQNGIKVAILNYTYLLNHDRMPSDMPYLVNLMTKNMSEKRVIADIKKAEEIADFTIVCPHWGTEYEFTVDTLQTYWTKIFLENGVDLVMGAHPHVIEPIEWVTNDQGNKMLVYYSLGNFVNGTTSTKGNLANRMVGGMAEVTIGRDETGKVVILENDVAPIVCHIGEGDSVTVYFLEDYTEKQAKENRICLQDSAFSLKACWDVVHQVWGE